MGFDQELFLAPTPDEFTCAVCMGVLERPRQCTNGHVFCEACITDWLQRKAECPTCKCKLTAASLVRNLVVERLILALRLRCPESRGDGEPPTKRPRTRQAGRSRDPGAGAPEACAWEGTVGDLERHRKQCLSVQVPCPEACGADLLRGQLEAHRATCPKRKAQCPHCQTTLLATQVSAHVATTCPDVPVGCACGQARPRKTLKEHKATECPVRPVDCPYHALGCTVRPKRETLPQHLADAAAAHAQLSIRELQALKDQIGGLVAKNTDLIRQNTHLRTSLQRLEMAVNDVKSKCDVETIDIHWKVKKIAQISRHRRTVCSEEFPILDYRMCLYIEFCHGDDDDDMYIGFQHTGGSDWVPINISCSFFTLETPGFTLKKEFHNTNIEASHQGQGRGVQVAVLHERNLCNDDQIEIDATLCVHRPSSFSLKTS